MITKKSCESVYDLSAVLIHKGTAVNSGHYVAHVKDEKTGQWWEFDDEQVSNLGSHPFGEGTSNSNTKPVKPEPVDRSCMEQKNAISNGDNVDVINQQPSESITSHVETFSCADAYMLMYSLSRSRKGEEKVHVECNANNRKIQGDTVCSSLPSHLCDEIESFNASYLDACEQYKFKKEEEMNNITERRQEVRSILSEAPVQQLEETFFWISTDWLRQWADNMISPALDNTSIQCSHGKVPVSKVGHMKRLSVKAWTKLFSKYKGGQNWPMMTTGMVTQWLKRKILDAPAEADAGPTASIRCPHGELMPEHATGAKRLLVPENLWLFLYEDALTVKPDDHLGCFPFPSDSAQCSQCSDELSEVALLLDTQFWLSKWKNYITANGKNISSVEKPETLDGIMDLLKCEKGLAKRCPMGEEDLSTPNHVNGEVECRRLMIKTCPEIVKENQGLHKDELSDQKMDAQHTEEGFRGTLLTTNVSSQVV
ncbi:hypothetical protein DVH24_026570 [Malus domestica]|uniref:ubiquitinyl hydrolase 1 n=1 Tax=Malus domestica TaxID=3750 RepID=A0A498KPX7_MALDO|nr:hypothetical protein DVH24_026570 [Malus domestica]